VTMTYSSPLALLVFGTFIWSAAGSCTCCQNKPLSSCIVAGEARDQSSCEFFDSTCEWDSTCGATDSTCTPNFECECFFCDFEMAFMFFGVLLTACTCCCFKSLNSRAERMDQSAADAKPGGWLDGRLTKLTHAYNCQQGENDEVNAKVRFSKACVMHLGVLLSFIFKVLALVESKHTIDELEVTRKNASLGTFDNCCSRITSLELTCLFYFLFSIASVVLLVMYNLYMVGGLHNPFTQDVCGGCGAVLLKQWCSVFAIGIAMAGVESSKSSAIDWGGGDCPSGGTVETKMNDVNASFITIAWQTGISIVIELIMVEVWAIKEGCKSTEGENCGTAVIPAAPAIQMEEGKAGAFTAPATAPVSSRTFHVTGAGVPAVNGIYKADGVMDGVPCYRNSNLWTIGGLCSADMIICRADISNTRECDVCEEAIDCTEDIYFTLNQKSGDADSYDLCKDCFGGLEGGKQKGYQRVMPCATLPRDGVWYIGSDADGSDEDGTFYRVQSNADSPPTDIAWVCQRDDAAPAPTLECIIESIGHQPIIAKSQL